MVDSHTSKVITLMRFREMEDLTSAPEGRYTNMEAALRATAVTMVVDYMEQPHSAPLSVLRWGAPAVRVRELIARAPNPPVVRVRARMSTYWGRHSVPTWLVVMKAAHMIRTRLLAGALIGWKTTIERLRLSRARIGVETALAALPEEARMRVLACLACPYDSHRVLGYLVTYISERVKGHIFGPVPALVTQPDELYDMGIDDRQRKSDLNIPYARSLLEWVARRL